MSQNCSNCYNGCAQIISDQCIKYTGIDVPVLGITKGDSLSFVEQALVSFLSSTLDGTGIQPIIASGDICEYVHQYFPVCETVTLNDVLTALIKATCAIRASAVSTNSTVASITSELTTLNANYTILCLSGVTNSSDTHAVVQSIISKLCQLITDVDANYVKISDLDELIQAYLDSIAASGNYYTRMVPYTAVEYYGTLANFDSSGAGIGAWQKLYLCNGQNGTPDKRGRVAVGAIAGVPGGALDAAVDPAFAFNLNYDISGANAVNGANSITLALTQVPAHIHNITDPGHTHSYIAPSNSAISTAGSALQYNNTIVGVTALGYTGISATDSSGGSQAHSNVQPVRACYYIMYLP